MLLSALVVSAFAAPEYHLELGTQMLPSSATVDARARVDGEKDGYIGLAGRVDPTGTWLGRASIGVDVFGGGDTVDLKLGLFLGGTGTLADPALPGRPAAGAEIQFGLSFGRIYGYYRHLDGFAGPLEDRLTEDELRLGFRVSDAVRVHGQYVVVNPGDTVARGGAGLGAEVVF